MNDVQFRNYYRPNPEKSMQQIISEMEEAGYEFEGGIPGDYSAAMREHHTPDSLRFRKRRELTLSDADVDRIARAVANLLRSSEKGKRP